MEILSNKTDAVLALFQTSKAERTERVNDIVELAAEGLLDPLQILLQVKCMEDMVTQFTSLDPKKNKNVAAAAQFRQSIIESAAKHGKKFTLHNASFDTKEVGTKYDYSVCEDEVYNDLIAQREALAAKITEREKYLQNIPEAGAADPQSGAMIYRARKSSSTSITVTLK